MKSYTITSHVADQVAALEAASVYRRRVLKPICLGIAALTPIAVVYWAARGSIQMAVITAGLSLLTLLVLGTITLAGPSKRDAAIKRAGAAGEAVLPHLLAALPDTYTLLNGVPVPGSRADIDHVLVGPMGVWSIEAKHHVGMVQCVGDAWGYTRLGAGGVPQEGHIGNPSQQARRSADALERYLQRRNAAPSGPPIQVQPIVVFTHPHVELTIEQPTLLILPAAELLPLLLRQPHVLAPETCQQLVATIRKLRPFDERR